MLLASPVSMCQVFPHSTLSYHPILFFSDHLHFIKIKISLLKLLREWEDKPQIGGRYMENSYLIKKKIETKIYPQKVLKLNHRKIDNSNKKLGKYLNIFPKIYTDSK